MARPTKYDIKFNEQVERLAMLGATDKQIANFFEVAESTLNLWKQEYPEFSESLKRGKLLADTKVAASLFKKAVGFTRKAVKIFNANGKPLVVPYTEFYPPDTTAQIFWLKNRQKEIWRDKQSIELDYEKLSDEDLDKIIDGILNRKQ
ncbi:hypothetical protein [Agriterribacter sp.]|uniref:hypothetical protein n=1 Tax=Agriterribacter sp. TaxID=2821509 RepID=UPI002BD75F2D|nr:hypothetical protein [Agriterribacter sp.]HTN08855.1 hypothetical protein [Agriterribacter sp.]